MVTERRGEFSDESRDAARMRPMGGGVPRSVGGTTVDLSSIIGSILISIPV